MLFLPVQGLAWAGLGSWPRRGSKGVQRLRAPGDARPSSPQAARVPAVAPAVQNRPRGEKPEAVSTSPCGQEAGLSASQRTPAGIRSSPPSGSVAPPIPRESQVQRVTHAASHTQAQTAGLPINSEKRRELAVLHLGTVDS